MPQIDPFSKKREKLSKNSDYRRYLNSEKQKCCSHNHWSTHCAACNLILASDATAIQGMIDTLMAALVVQKQKRPSIVYNLAPVDVQAISITIDMNPDAIDELSPEAYPAEELAVEQTA